ncbi:hypothetical protein [Serratia marcescens]|uniref:hypothetical protein n=1 Tax=Serratia marcescens TaxID=615 RepID=UPI000744E169|nr:hypothetical protein [Serratia marcescens]CVA87215.1 Uncharacterised protein [Serratia marcescens]
MPQPLPKFVEINDELTDRLSAGSVLSEMEFYRYIRSIEAVNDRAVQSYLYAMANAAYGQKEKAVAFFEEALSYRVDIAPDNYLAYINDAGSFSEVKELSHRLAKSVVKKQIFHSAYQTSIFSGNLEQASFYAKKYINIADVKESQEMASSLSDATKEIQKFKERSGLSDADFQMVADATIRVVETHGCKISGLSYQSIREESAHSYVVLVKSSDPEKVAEMNIDLAFALADYDQLTDKRFSAWFKGQEADHNASFS